MHCGICGSKMTPTYAKKKDKRYRYYICVSKHKGRNEDCKVGRVLAGEAEELITNQVLNLPKKPEVIMQTIAAKQEDLPDSTIINSFKSIDKVWDELFPVEQARVVSLLIKDVEIKEEGLNIRVFKEGINSLSSEFQ